MFKRQPKQIHIVLLAVVFFFFSLNALASNTWYVNGVTGNNANDGRTAATAYRTIIHAISMSTSGDSITVAAATYMENLNVPFDLTIAGSAARTTIIDGGHSATVVTISNANAHVRLSQVTIRNGSGLLHGGGGIYNVGNLTIANTIVSGNSSNDSAVAIGGLGGGIYNAGTLTVVASTISGNSVSRFRLSASPYGGGIYNAGTLTVINSTVNANQAVDYWPSGVPYGGGIANESGTAIISNSTISTNTALIHTPFGSAGTYGGGIYNNGSANARFQNSILANNTSGGNCTGTLNSLGYNMSSDSTCHLNGPGDQRSINPMLGALQNNGGPTNTMALLTGSPAMNAGNPNGCTDGSGHLLTTDQRGVTRPTPCDMGAYEH
jgi:hypothetical protein